MMPTFIRRQCRLALFTASIAGALLSGVAIAKAAAAPALTGAGAAASVTPAGTRQAHCACFHVTVVGSGKPLLLIPGLTSTGAVWQHTVDALQDQYQLHVLTLAGFGGVTPLSSSQWQQGYLQSQQQAILQYIRDQQLEKPVLIGHSLGGYLALAVATAAPAEIGAVINVDGLPALGALFAQTAAKAAGNHTASHTAKQTTDQTARQATTTGAAAAAKPANAQTARQFDPQQMAKGMANNPHWHARIAEDMRVADGMTTGRVMAELMQADLRPKLAQLQLPVLTLGGLQSGAPYSESAQVQANFEQQLAGVPPAYRHFAFAADARHFIMADAPDWLTEQISSFIRQHHK